MPSWYPGQTAIGSKVFSQPVGLAGGFWSNPPSVTTPGTVLSPGTVPNATGYDVMVYATSTTGISKAVLAPGGTALGTIAPGQTGSYYVPSNASIILTYTGTLTWKWMAV